MENDAIKQVGPYRIEVECGRGGMSVVYSATHDSLKTRHAIKVFDVSNCENAKVLRGKFLAEARILAVLRHPNIVRVTDYGVMPDGRPWLARDIVDGTALSVKLADTIPPTPGESLSFYQEIRSALSYCHSRGIVHGDLKAENIILRQDGHVVLSDFGIARILNPQMRERLELTDSCEAGGFGTAYALATECREGALATPCSDVYSFGVLLFKVVTGIWYDGSERLKGRLKSFAPEWAQTLGWMLERDPSRRPATAEELPTDPITKRPYRVQIKKAALVTTATAICLLVGGFAIGAFETEPQRIESGTTVVLRAGRKAVMSTAAHIGYLSLPDTDGQVRIDIPSDFTGVLLAADEVEGNLHEQIRISPQPGMRVLYRGNREVIIKRQ